MKNFHNPSPLRLYLCIFIISILLSIMTILVHPIFNPDGVRYLWGAYLYQSQGLHASMKFYPWPFYSMTIVWLSKLTALSLLHASYLMNIILDAFTTVIFVKAVKQLGGSWRVLCWAALIFLVWQEFNGFRYDIIRGHGYWLFLLLSLCCFFKFLDNNRWRFAVLWAICMVIAVLYRVEGVVLLCFQPFVVFFQKQAFSKRFMNYCQLNIVTLLCGVVMLVYLLVHMEHHTTAHVGRLSDPTYMLSHLGDFWKLPFLPFYPRLLITVLSWGYLFVLAYAFAVKAVPKKSLYLKTIFWFIFLNIILSIVVYFNYKLLAQRYVFPIGLALLFFVPFGLEQLYQDWRTRISHLSLPGILFPVVMFLMLVMLIGSLVYFGPSKAYEQQAIDWLKTQHNVRLYTSEPIIAMRYKKDFWQNTAGWQQAANTESHYDWSLIKEQPWGKTNYAAFMIDHTRLARRTQLISLLGQPIKQFSNERGDVVVVFKLSQ